MRISVANGIASSGWVLVLAWWAYSALPVSLSVSYQDLAITDAFAEGASPQVTPTTDFHKTVLLRWHRTLLKNDSADWLPICRTEGEGIRYAGFSAQPTTLDALFDSRPCAKKLEAGEYYVEEDMEWDDLVVRSLVIESNVFRVDEQPAARIVRAPASTPTPATDAPKPHRVHKRPAAPRFPWPFSLMFR